MPRPERESAATPLVAVEGRCDRAFAPAREAFCGNFRERRELAGAVCVMAGAASWWTCGAGGLIWGALAGGGRTRW